MVKKVLAVFLVSSIGMVNTIVNIYAIKYTTREEIVCATKAIEGLVTTNLLIKPGTPETVFKHGDNETGKELNSSCSNGI